MLSNCGVGKDSWESLGLQGDQTSQYLRKSTLNIHWKDWCWCWSFNTLVFIIFYVQFSSVPQSCPTLCDPMNCSTPGLSVHHQLLEFTQTHVHQVSDAIQPSHPLSSPSPPVFSLSKHKDLFQWVNSSHQVVKVLELQLQHQFFQWIFRVDFL